MQQPGRIVKKWPARPPPPANGPRRKYDPPNSAVGGITQAPVATNSYVKGNRKARVITRDGRTVVRHRELITTIIGQGAGFAVNNGSADAYPLNPLEPSTFKWLSTLAAGYDTYNILNCCLEYVPLCSTAFVGRVGIFYDRDSSDFGPFDRNELSNFAYLVETSPWAPATLELPDLRGERFMKDAITDEAKFVDAGRIGWATYNTGTNDINGDLFICYEIELLNAQPATSGISNVRIGAPGSAATSNGPRYILQSTFAQAATSTAAIRLTTGTYQVMFICDTSAGTITGTSMTITGDASFNGVFNFYSVFSTTRAMVVANITVRDTKAVITHNVVGGTVSLWQVTAARAVASQTLF